MKNLKTGLAALGVAAMFAASSCRNPQKCAAYDKINLDSSVMVDQDASEDAQSEVAVFTVEP